MAKGDNLRSLELLGILNQVSSAINSSPNNIYIDPSVLKEIFALDKELSSVLDDLNLNYDEKSRQLLRRFVSRSNRKLSVVASKKSNTISTKHSTIGRRGSAKTLTDVAESSSSISFYSDDSINSKKSTEIESAKKKNLVIKCNYSFLTKSSTKNSTHVYRHDSSCQIVPPLCRPQPCCQESDVSLLGCKGKPKKEKKKKEKKGSKCFRKKKTESCESVCKKPKEKKSKCRTKKSRSCDSSISSESACGKPKEKKSKCKTKKSKSNDCAVGPQVLPCPRAEVQCDLPPKKRRWFSCKSTQAAKKVPICNPVCPSSLSPPPPPCRRSRLSRILSNLGNGGLQIQLMPPGRPCRIAKSCIIPKLTLPRRSCGINVNRPNPFPRLKISCVPKPCSPSPSCTEPPPTRPLPPSTPRRPCTPPNPCSFKACERLIRSSIPCKSPSELLPCKKNPCNFLPCKKNPCIMPPCKLTPSLPRLKPCAVSSCKYRPLNSSRPCTPPLFSTSACSVTPCRSRRCTPPPSCDRQFFPLRNHELIILGIVINIHFAIRGYARLHRALLYVAHHHHVSRGNP
ncbi:hypothetical protein HHI36_011815 [Cryptolaemus montrouzieri]|uniref:Uncharacterized protein n=1 Tax=Cryptolaemus montrouzieri TaxID=559131 RepID=A0ABD2NE18_9CUCU